MGVFAGLVRVLLPRSRRAQPKRDQVFVLFARLNSDPDLEALVGVAFDLEGANAIASRVDSDHVRCLTESHDLADPHSPVAAAETVYLAVASETPLVSLLRDGWLWHGPAIVEQAFVDSASADAYALSDESMRRFPDHNFVLPIEVGWVNPRVLAFSAADRAGAGGGGANLTA